MCHLFEMVMLFCIYAAQNSGYASEELDEPENDAMEVDEETSPTKKRKLTKAAEAKLKAQEKKKLGKKDSDDEDDDDDAYTAPSKSIWASSGGPKPPVGNFEKCAICEKQFTVVCTYISSIPHCLIPRVDQIYYGGQFGKRLPVSSVREGRWKRPIQETCSAQKAESTGRKAEHRQL